ncbi:MAG: tRNA 5'-guanylyltransferase [Methanomicrobiales archaeon]|jgi:tRNA(His) 5'-end guanylyltransferase|nr:tRNA 5'-guanylyltransferase [Methanomicrobiales archaeon]
MKKREIFSDLRALPPIIVRLDGRAFHRLTQRSNFSEPFDEKFADAMSSVTKSLMVGAGFAPVFGYTFSDEISLYFTEDLFLGRIEKIDSVLASYAASALTIALNLPEPVSFDARIIPVTRDLVIPYLAWRQQEAWRNHMNGWSQKLLRDEGYSPKKAAMMLDRMKAPELHELCFQRGVNLAATPAWQRRGIFVHRTIITKKGFNPVTKENTETTRRVVIIDKNPPLFGKSDGKEFIKQVLSN